MTFQTAYASEVIDYITGRAVATTTPKTTYLMGLTAPVGPTDTLATISEDNTPGYARQQIVWSVPAIPTDPAQGDQPVSSNAAEIAFGPYTAATANPITQVALVDAGSGTVGKIRWVWDLDESFSAAVGDTMLLPIGAVSYGLLG